MKISREYIKRVGKNNSYVSNTKGGSSSGGGGEGASSLKQLRDTAIENEADGDVLVYNASDEKWKNQEKAPKAVHADEADEANHADEADHAKEADEVPWTGVQDVITGGNEFNICDTTPSSNKMWFNYTGRQGSQLSSAITEYDFGNGRGSRSGVTVKAENFEADGYVTALSDIREKDLAGAVELNLDEIADAPAVRFVWKHRENHSLQAGTVAQYWEDVLPEVVKKRSDGMLSMDYAVAALVSAITLAREVRTLKEKLEKLEKEHRNNVKLKT